MKLRPFELGLVIFFSVAIVITFILINSYKGGSKSDPTTSTLAAGVTVWGTVQTGVFADIFKELSGQQEGFKRVSYIYIPSEDFEQRFINSLADQTPPDLLLIPHELLATLRPRLQPIPYSSFPQRDFLNTYIDGASVFALSDGIYAYPLAVDPLVMYWNKNILSENNFLYAPTTWEEIINDVAPVTTVRDFNREVTRSTLAMGDFSNVKNAFPILSTLLIQSGSSFVSEKLTGSKFSYTLNLNNANVSGKTPLTDSLNFYTNFSNTNSTVYNWNRSLGLDYDLFLQEKLALYLGFGSEGRVLELKNPNLSFDIAEMPQGEGVKNKRTYGTFYGLAVTKNAKNRNGAFIVSQALARENYTKRIADSLNMASTFKKTVQQGSNDVYGRVIYSSAINARGWLNPRLEKSKDVFKEAVDDIGANRTTPANISSDVNKKLQTLYQS